MFLIGAVRDECLARLRRWWNCQPDDFARGSALLAMAAVWILVSFLLYVIFSRPGPLVRIFIDGHMVEMVELRTDDDYLIDLTEPYGVSVKLEVKDGGIRFLESSCADQCCKSAGALSAMGDCAVCAANEVSVAVVRGTASIYDLRWENGDPVFRKAPEN